MPAQPVQHRDCIGEWCDGVSGGDEFSECQFGGLWGRPRFARRLLEDGHAQGSHVVSQLRAL